MNIVLQEGDIKRNRYYLIVFSIIFSFYAVINSYEAAGVEGISTQKALDLMGLDKKSQGDDIVIAVIDTGITKHSDFKNTIIYFRDFVNNRKEPYDDNGHGTEVSGIIAGSGKCSDGRYVGIAPKAKLVVLKVLDIRVTCINRLNG